MSRGIDKSGYVCFDAWYKVEVIVVEGKYRLHRIGGCREFVE